MGPTTPQNELKLGSKCVPGGFLAAFGRPTPFGNDFGAILGPMLGPCWGPKSSKNKVQKQHKSHIDVHRHFKRVGSRFGPILELPGTSKIMFSPRRESKFDENRCFYFKSAWGAFCERLWRHFGAMLGSKFALKALPNAC